MGCEWNFVMGFGSKNESVPARSIPGSPTLLMGHHPMVLHRWEGAVYKTLEVRPEDAGRIGWQ